MLTPPRRLLASLAVAATLSLVSTPAASAIGSLSALGSVGAAATAGSVGSAGSAGSLAGAGSLGNAGSGGDSGSPGTLGSLGALGSTGSSDQAPRTYDSYVALGDSYAALGDRTRPAGGPAGCARSLANYPNQLDAGDARIGDLTDVTCGGAQIPDLTEPQFPGAPGQLEALDADTDLVTLSIGGNDVGFGLIVGCITKQGPFAGTPDCEAEIGDAVDADIAETFGVGGQIDQVYDAIETASPDATIIATQYMPLMPETGSCAFTDQLNPDDVQWSREVAEAINDAVDAAAARNGHISVLPTDDVDRSACASVDQRWTDFTGIETNTAPMHPTALGQQAMAGAIGAVL